MAFEPVLTRGIGTLDLVDINVYEQQGGYEGLRKALKMTPEEVTAEVLNSGLRGRGGAGFPTGRKWTFLPNNGEPRYLVVNADESEPGTFSNRMLIEYHPHQLIEGMLIAAYAIQAARTFIYFRGEFWRGHNIFVKALHQAREKGYLGANILGSGFDMEIVPHRGAGAYICGEETGLLSSLEGGRGEPRLKPPFPAVQGLYAKPTIVNNVETLSNVPHIIARGADWFKSIGTERSPGPKIYSVSGLVKKPGNYELPLGVTLREVIFEHAGGMLDGRKFKAAQPGGGSSGVLVEQHLDTPMDFDSIMAAGSMLGTAGVIVFDNTTCMVQVGVYLNRFYANESCGQCTPCREGTHWISRILERFETGGGRPEDIEVLKSLKVQMAGTTICVLSDASLGYIQSAIKYFPEEFEAHIRGKCCGVPPILQVKKHSPAHSHNVIPISAIAGA